MEIRLVSAEGVSSVRRFRTVLAPITVLFDPDGEDGFAPVHALRTLGRLFRTGKMEAPESGCRILLGIVLPGVEHPVQCDVRVLPGLAMFHLEGNGLRAVLELSGSPPSFRLVRARGWSGDVERDEFFREEAGKTGGKKPPSLLDLLRAPTMVIERIVWIDSQPEASETERTELIHRLRADSVRVAAIRNAFAVVTGERPGASDEEWIAEATLRAFGLVDLLARMHEPGARLVVLEEPERRMLGGAADRLARVLTIARSRDQGRRFLIATRSQELADALVRQARAGLLYPGELAVYIPAGAGESRFLARQWPHEDEE